MKNKLKARDIIPDWPRGRSTTPDKHLQKLEWLVFWQLRFYWNEDERIRYELLQKRERFEYEYEKTYHQMQQAMINEWFARYRLGDEVFNKCMIVKIYTGYRRVLRATLARPVEFCNGLYLPCDFRRVS